MRIYVARHGVTDMNKRGVVNGEIDEPLAAEGVVQAQNAAALIPPIIRHIYSSPLIRAEQTAKIFGTAGALPVTVDSRLTEVKMGSLAGMAWTEMPSGAELKKLHRTVKFDYTTFGGESVAAVVTRLRSFIADIEANHRQDEVLIVTHGGVIRVLTYLGTNEAVYETTENTGLLTFETANLLA